MTIVDLTRHASVWIAVPALILWLVWALRHPRHWRYAVPAVVWLLDAITWCIVALQVTPGQTVMKVWGNSIVLYGALLALSIVVALLIGDRDGKRGR